MCPEEEDSVVIGDVTDKDIGGLFSYHNIFSVLKINRGLPAASPFAEA